MLEGALQTVLLNPKIAPKMAQHHVIMSDKLLAKIDAWQLSQKGTS